MLHSILSTLPQGPVLVFEFILLLLFLYAGSRYGGIGLGVVSGIGLVVEVFVLGMPPSKAPVEVMLIILAVVSCASILEAAGGLKYMLQIAEKILRNNPKYITFLGPFVTYTLTILLGTGHAVYSIMPIIADVSLKNKVRPERPMAAASVASQLAITGSPISAAVVYYLASIGVPELSKDLSLLNILCVTIPATFLGTVAMCVYSLFRGKDLDKDPEFQRKMEDPEFRTKIESAGATSLNEVLPPAARNSVLIFLSAIALVVVIAMLPKEYKTFIDETGKPVFVKMDAIIQMMMLAFGGIILIATKTKPSTVPNGVVFKSGMVAAIAIYGIGWMSDTYFTHAMPVFKQQVQTMVQTYPWTFAFACFAVSVVVNSQAATAKIILPVGIALGLNPALLIGLMPATYGYFFIPNYPSDIATVNFDSSGTTKIGKYYFNHSFMTPGLIGVVIACCVGVFLGKMFVP